MMSLPVRVAVMSDIHLEFAPYEPQLVDVDLVLLAGDIHCPGVCAIEWAKCLGMASALVMGNHEAYKSDLSSQIMRMRQAADGSSCAFLDNDVYIFQKGDRRIRILGRSEAHKSELQSLM